MSFEKTHIPAGKIFVVGAGHVGSHAAFALASECIASEIALYDINLEKARAQAEDLADAVVYQRSRTKIFAAENYSAAHDADLLIVAAGPLPDIAAGQTDRAQTLYWTLDVLDKILPEIVASGFHGVIVNISNPADVITHYIQNELAWKPAKIFSTSTTLDSARLRRVLATRLGVAPQSVFALMLGEHGETQTPAWSLASVGGEPLLHYISRNVARLGNVDLDALARESRLAGWRILGGKCSTEFGIGSSIAEISRTIFFDEKRVFPVAVRLDGQYGQSDVFASVPAVIGAGGVEEILELPLNAKELSALAVSCKKNRELFEKAVERSRSRSK